MINQSKIARFLGPAMFAAAFMMFAGSLTEANAQRDPFEKPAWARQRDPQSAAPGAPGSVKPGSPAELGVPAIEQRIDYYKRLRQDAVAGGMPVPKVTSVLTLGELAVTGIFKTPRGYAAMVEATPIKLSYTIYPGEKLFDGQLVAVEENRLVFRRVTKMSNGKFVSAVENKSLRKYTDKDFVQGTAPSGADTTASRPAPAQPTAADGSKVAVVPVVSPLSEMEKAAVKTSSNEADKKAAKKPVKKIVPLGEPMSEAEVDEMVSDKNIPALIEHAKASWRKHAPPEFRDLLDAKKVVYPDDES
jgi:hypothetical protein